MKILSKIITITLIFFYVNSSNYKDLKLKAKEIFALAIPSRDVRNLISEYTKEWSFYKIRNISDPKGNCCFSIYSPDSKYIAVANGNKIKIFNDTEAFTIDKKSSILAYSPDNKHLASIYTSLYDREISIFDSQSHKLLKSISIWQHYDLCSIVYSSDSKFLAANGENGDICIFDVQKDYKFLHEIKSQISSLQLRFSSDGQHLASLSNKEFNKIKIYNTSNYELLHVLDYKKRITHIAYSPNNKYFALCLKDGTVKILHANSYELTNMSITNKCLACVLEYSPDNKYLASGYQDGIIKIFDSQTFELIKILNGHKEVIGSLAFSSNNKYLVSSDIDQIVVIWTLKDLTDIL